MIPCTNETFIKNGLNTTEKNIVANKRLCPNMTGMEDFAYLKNSYSNKLDRKSMSIQVVLGNHSECASYDSDCPFHDQIDKFLSYLYFSLYIVEENIEFTNDIKARPISTSDKFHS
jgi:hypothetical protein